METKKMAPSNTVYISNLSYRSDRNGLKTMFMAFGTVLDIKIIVEPKSNQSRGMAFVEMSSIAEADKAIAGLDGKVFGGRTVKAKYATPMSAFKVASKEEAKNQKNRELRTEEIQLEKKARNVARRKANPIVMKYVPAKKS